MVLSIKYTGALNPKKDQNKLLTLSVLQPMAKRNHCLHAVDAPLGMKMPSKI
jgi:hypothetical protein